MWDVQTGGLIHTFTTKSPISEITVSPEGEYIACVLSNGFVTSWDIHTKARGNYFGNGQPVVAACWLEPQELAVATQNSICICDIGSNKTSNLLPIPDPVLGMVLLADKNGILVGTLGPSVGEDQGVCLLKIVCYLPKCQYVHGPLGTPWMYTGKLVCPTLVGDECLWISPPSGVVSFNIVSNNWTDHPPLLDTATSVAGSLGRNLVAQTKDSIQIFSLDVLTSDEVRNAIHPSHVYPLGEEHIVCLLQPNRDLALLQLETVIAHDNHDHFTLFFSFFSY